MYFDVCTVHLLQFIIQTNLLAMYKIVNVHGSAHRKNILIYEFIQQDATLHSLFYLETTLHVLVGTSTHHQERIQLYLQHLVFVTPLLLLAAIGVWPQKRSAALKKIKIS
jgi:hypothetical protein